jgi:two-component system response regulator NreC
VMAKISVSEPALEIQPTGKYRTENQPDPGSMTRIFLADHDQILLQSLEEVLQHKGFEVCGETADHDAAIRQVAELHPAVLILGLSAPVMSCLEVAKEIRRSSPETQIVALTDHDEGQYILDALKAGIRGYVLRSQTVEELVQAMREVAGGGTYLSPRAWNAVIEAYLSKSAVPADPLTPRERQVLQLMAEGKTTKEIAGLLSVSAKTVEFHRSRTMDKLNIHTTAGLIRHAIRRGLVPP